MLELPPDGLMVAEADGNIRVANAQCGTLFGYTCDELIGRPIEILVPAIRLSARLTTARPPRAALAPAESFAAAAKPAPFSPWQSALARFRPGAANPPRSLSRSATLPSATSSPIAAAEASYRPKGHTSGVTREAISQVKNASTAPTCR
jgi:hypothetical protein